MIKLKGGSGLKYFQSPTLNLSGGYVDENLIYHNLNTMKITSIQLVKQSDAQVEPNYFHYWNNSGGSAYNAQWSSSIIDENTVKVWSYWLSGEYNIRIYAI